MWRAFSQMKRNTKNMDKKKVKEMIEDAIFRLTVSRADEHTIQMLDSLLRELFKSDWISVKDELPPYEKTVLVCNENDPTGAWFCHRSCNPHDGTHEDDWCNPYPVAITHWQEVEMDEINK